MADDARRALGRPVAADGEPVLVRVHVGIGAVREAEMLRHHPRRGGQDGVGVGAGDGGPAQCVKEAEAGLVLPRFLLRPAPRGDVDRGAQCPHAAAGLVEHAPALGGNPAHEAVLPADRAVLHVVGGPLHGIEGRGEGRGGRLAILGVQPGVEVVDAAGRVRRDAEHRLGAVRPGQHVGERVEIPGADLGRLDGEVPRFLAEGETFPVGLPLGRQGRVLALEGGHALPLQRHVELAGEEVGQLAGGVVDRRHEQPVPERRTVLAVVADVGLNGARRGDGLAELLHDGRIGLRSLQEAAVAPHDLVAIVAGQAAERVVDEDDWVVGQPRVRDDHRHARGVHGRDEGINPPIRTRYLGADPRLVPFDLLRNRPRVRRFGEVTHGAEALPDNARLSTAMLSRSGRRCGCARGQVSRARVPSRFTSKSTRRSSRGLYSLGLSSRHDCFALYNQVSILRAGRPKPADGAPLDPHLSAKTNLCRKYRPVNRRLGGIAVPYPSPPRLGL
ncbi:hypothetical protein OCOJLMKI_2850 [Methylobacterium iners]|uniref:Uncharacterized protein n=1 Tax=Methylobacterium iners TaxID=418707 RepID=A0ABQ4S1H0_9HYPH|nr:hypothetical protein OCOJLMKI_2850 [Methylobacterium iners]